MRDEYLMNIEGFKDYGPRVENSMVVEGTQKVVPGCDFLFTD